MAQIIRLTLSLPPSTNRYWRKTKTGNVYISEDAKAYRQEVALRSAQLGRIAGDVAVTLRIYRKIRSGDLDNRIKVLFDALQGNCLKDDNQVIEIHAYRFDDKTNPRVEVEITEL